MISKKKQVKHAKRTKRNQIKDSPFYLPLFSFLVRKKVWGLGEETKGEGREKILYMTESLIKPSKEHQLKYSLNLSFAKVQYYNFAL